MPFCPICQEHCYDGFTHKCPPTWDVWQDGEEEDLDPSYASQVYADTAQVAALKFADSHSDDGPWKHDVFVRQVDMDGPASRFEFSCYLQPVYEISKTSLYAPATPTPTKETTQN